MANKIGKQTIQGLSINSHLIQHPDRLYGPALIQSEEDIDKMLSAAKEFLLELLKANGSLNEAIVIFHPIDHPYWERFYDHHVMGAREYRKKYNEPANY